MIPLDPARFEAAYRGETAAPGRAEIWWRYAAETVLAARRGEAQDAMQAALAGAPDVPTELIEGEAGTCAAETLAYLTALAEDPPLPMEFAVCSDALRIRLDHLDRWAAVLWLLAQTHPASGRGDALAAVSRALAMVLSCLRDYGDAPARPDGIHHPSTAAWHGDASWLELAREEDAAPNEALLAQALRSYRQPVLDELIAREHLLDASADDRLALDAWARLDPAVAAQVDAARVIADRLRSRPFPSPGWFERLARRVSTALTEAGAHVSGAFEAIPLPVASTTTGLHARPPVGSFSIGQDDRVLAELLMDAVDIPPALEACLSHRVLDRARQVSAVPLPKGAGWFVMLTDTEAHAPQATLVLERPGAAETSVLAAHRGDLLVGFAAHHADVTRASLTLGELHFEFDWPLPLPDDPPEPE